MAQTTGFTVWLTGMHGSGKSTLAHYLAQRFRATERRVEVIDHDDVDPLLLKGLTTSKDDRLLATRRVGLLAKVLTRNDCVAIVAALSPYREARDQVRREVNRFAEVFVDCPTEVLISRDTTGQYKKALSGELPNFTGVTDPYETPQHAEITIRTDQDPVEQSAAQVIQGLVDVGYLTPAEASVMLNKRVRPTPPRARAAARAAAGKAKKSAKAAPPKAATRSKAKATKVVAMARTPSKVAHKAAKPAGRKAGR